jgi:hypothetical protein
MTTGIKQLAASVAILTIAALAFEIRVPTGSNVKVAIGTGGPWIDSMVPAAGFKLGSSAPTWGNFTDANIQVLTFAKSAADIVYGSLQLNHGYKEGSDIHPHCHVWFPTAAVATASTNVWKLTYSWGSIGSAFPASASVIVTNDGAITQYEHRVINFGAISGTSKTMSSIIAVAIERTGTDAYDIYDDAIGFLGFDVHYQTDSLGSSQEYIK